MAYTPGWRPDQQFRVAREASNQGHLDGPLPLISSGGGPPIAQRDWPNPSLGRRTEAFRVARSASFTGESDTLLPDLFGQDAAGGSQVWTLPPAYLDKRNQPRYIAIRSNSSGESTAILPQFLNQDQMLGAPGQVQNYQLQQALPPRAATRPLENQGYVDGTEYWLLAPTSPPLPTGAQSFDLPVTLGPRLGQYRIARSAANEGQYDTILPNLVGQDSLTVGDQYTELAPRAALRAQTDTYSVYDASEFWMLADSVNVGQQSFDLPPRAALRARDYSFTQATPLNLLIPVGAQITDLVPRAASRARDYSVAAAFPLVLVGQDAFNPGAQLSGNAPAGARRAQSLVEPGVNNTVVVNSAPPTIPAGLSTALSELAPRGPLRARDYSLAAGFTLELIGQDALPVGDQLSGNAPAAALRSRDYTWAQPVALNLLGQDAFAPGEQAYDLAPRAASRAREYTWLQSLPLNLNGQDSLTVGVQFSGPAPAGARRASTLSDPGVNLTLIVSQAPPVIPYGLSTDLTVLPPRTAARAREYSIAASFPLELIGQDAYAPGDQLSGNVPSGPRRASTLSDPGQNQLPILTTVSPVGNSAVDQIPRGYLRARDYSIAEAFTLELIGQDALPVGDQLSGNTPAGARRASTLGDPGQNQALYLAAAAAAVFPVGSQSVDLAPRGPARAKEYGQASSFPLELNGKDQIYSASGEVPSYDWPNPRGPLRARDYSWYQSFPLYIFQQLPPGQSTADSEPTPRAPQRARDYSWLANLPQHLIGQDTLYGQPGEVLAYDWQLPTPRATRMRDYSWVQTAPAGSGVPPRDLFYIVSPPQAKWVFSELTEAKWRTFGLPPGKWHAANPSQ